MNEAAPNDQVVKLKALETMQKVADGKATKIIIPSEIQGLAGLAASAKAVFESEAQSPVKHCRILCLEGRPTGGLLFLTAFPGELFILGS